MCDCPARLLDPNLVGQYCQVCNGVYGPLNDMDRRIIAAAQERDRERWHEEYRRWNTRD